MAADPFKEFGATARHLAHSPLGIIALFLVLVYGFAALLTAGANMTPDERIPLVYFLVVFPNVVFAVFTWLVVCHSEKLFGPGHFKDERNFLKMRSAATAMLIAATSKQNRDIENAEINAIVATVQQAELPKGNSEDIWKNKILWVDDRPDNNTFERQAFEAVGIEFTLSTNTKDALNILSKNKFSAVISDMGRKEGPREGYKLLDAMRQKNDMTPLFFYASSGAPEHRRETEEHGGQGCTNNANELFGMVTKIVFGRR